MKWRSLGCTIGYDEKVPPQITSFVKITKKKEEKDNKKTVICKEKNEKAESTYLYALAESSERQ